MKKIFTISAVILLLLLISVYGYLQFRQYQSYKSRIHQQADLILRINVDGLISANGFKFLRTPPRFLDLVRDSSGIQKGFSVPATIFIYTVSSRSAGTYFCSLPLSDTSVLKQYLKKALNIVRFRPTNEGEILGASADGKLTIAYHGDHLAASYSLKKENTEDILLDLLRGKNLMEGSDKRMVRLREEKDNFAYDFRGFTGHGNLHDATLSVRGSFPLNGLGIPEQIYGRSNFQPQSAVKVWLNADLRKLFQKEKFCVKGLCIEGDSLSKYYGAYTDLEIGQMIKQKDSVVTYVYNDDFEKEEQIELKETQVPDISLSFSGNGTGIDEYLKQQKIIDGQNRLNKELFPLYQVYSKAEPKMLRLGTNQERSISPLKLRSPFFLFTDINFDQIKKEGIFPLLNPYLKTLSRLQIKAGKESEEKGHFEMEVIFSSK